MKIKETFKNLERYKGLIQNYQDYINYYIDCLNDDNKLIEYIERPQSEILNVQKSRNITAPQEREVIKKEIGRKQAKEELEYYKGKRNDLYDKLYILEKSLEYLEKLPRGEEMLYVIECRYIDRMRWSDVENNFNSRFRKDDYDIGYNSINNINSKSLKLLQEYADSYPVFKINYNEELKKINFKLI